MKIPQHQYSMSVAATILLGLASFAAAQTSSFKDPLTGEPIPLIKRSDIRMPRRKIQATCDEAIDIQNQSYYHPTLDPDKGATCTNLNDYPMIWKEIPKASNIPQYISSTGQECCEKFYERQGVPAGTCRIEDVCNPPEIILGLWHSSKYDPTTCTNSGDYPVSWNDEEFRPYHLFETSDKCCAEVERKTSQACDVLDVEAEWSCDKWHLAIEKDEDDFAIHPDGTCTNSGIIYDVWMAKQDVYVFPNHQACCDNFKIAYDDCHKVDECAEPTNPPTPLPTTKAPTPVPTPVPTTKAPTPVPTTKAPTRSPVVFDIEAYTCDAASSSENGRFHIDKYGSLSCSNSDDYPPSWESVLDSDGNHKFLFDTMEECVAYFTPFLKPGETVKSVNVCSPDCCSYMKEHNLPFVEEQCEGGCEVTTTTTSTTTTTTMVPELNDPECEKAAAYYHPPRTMDAPYCTNSVDYPQSWHNVLDENGNKMFLFTSIDDCCDYFAKSGVPRENCVEVDVCSSDCCSYTKENNLPFEQCQGGCTTTTTTTTTTAPGSCENGSFSLYWHPSTSDDILCTNSPGYPTSWRTRTITPKFLYESAEDCCKNYYGSFNIPTELCEMEDLCPDGKLVSVAADEPITTSTTTSTTITTTTSSPPSSSPTRNPTNLPTHSPSDSPTRNPTNLPTHSPSDSPTKRPSDKPVADVVCAEVWEPVCGEDGVSYSNDCEAIKADVKVVSAGECCSPGGKCSVEGSSCSVGTETCCGQTYDSLKCECSEERRWLCLIFDEACPSPCPQETTTTTTTSTAAASNDAKWFPDTVNDEPTCRYGSDYPLSYEGFGWLFDDDVDDSGEVIKTGEQKCCVEYNLPCQFQSKFNDDMWYPDTVNGDKTCEYGNEYPLSYALSNGMLFDSEIECCIEFNLSHCIPKEPKWFPKLSDDGSKGCVYEVPPSEMPTTFLFLERDDCCVAYPEACPTTTLPTTTTPRPSIETPDCEESAEGNECAWWPELVSTEEGYVLHCQYSSSWPEVAADHLSPDNDGNGYYACCDKYSCTKNADGSYVNVMEERSNTATNAPTPLPSNGPTSEPTRLPSRSPSTSPTRNPTNLPTHLPSGSPTRNPTNLPTHLPSDSPTKRPSDKPVADVVCAELWDPVCGEDGVSYSNDCEANKVDVKVAYEGECCSPGGKCSVEGSSCSVGTETCCGQTYDSLKCECSEGPDHRWECIMNEACMLPCPEETTTTTTSSTAAASNDAKWFPDTVNDEPTCRYGSDYPLSYEGHGWLFDDDVDDSGEVIKTGEQKCCVKYNLQCQFQSKFNDDMWYPDTVNGDKTCEYGNEYPLSYALSNGMLFDSEIECCIEFNLSHCIPKEPKWFPKLSDDGSKGCVYEVPASEMPSTFLFLERDDCCVAYPEACPTTTLPTTTTPRPSIETPDCEESAEGNECAWWPELVSTEEGYVLHCQYSSSWPEVAADHLSPDNDGNGYYACCDKYSCTKNADGSYVNVMEERSNTATNAPTPLPSNGPTSEPTRLPSRSPSTSPTRNPTNLPTHLPSGSPTRNPTNLPTHLPSDSPTKRPSDKPVADVVCAEVWEPVCGEDGVSYSNDCEAIKADVKVVSVGECEVPAERCSPGDKCSVEGSSCSVGTETCCGQTYDSLKCECSEGLWLCLVTEACRLPCSPTFAPTTVTRQPTPLPSKDPTNTPTMRPVDATTTTTTVAATTTTSGEMVTHSSGLCGKWHVSREAPSTCTNSGVGMAEPTSDCRDWYRSGEDCCNLFFGREDCPKVDVTVTTTKATTTTTAATTRSCGEWHVSRVNMKTCTNSREGMREPGPDCAEWYASGEECCFSYLRGAECQIIDVSGDTTSTEATLPLSHCDEWHPNPSDSTKCTNSDVYPSVWREYYYDRFFFRTAEACCEQREQQGSRCSVVDVCTFCTEEYSPVCGSDGSTYGNKCKAKAAGINLFVTGTCDEVVAATTTTTTSTTTTPATTTTTTTPETTTTTPATTTTTTNPATTTTTTTPATTTTTTTPVTTTTTTTTPATTTTTTTPATTTTTTSTTSATTTSDPGDMEENSGTLGTTTTTTPATTTTTTTPATTTTTTSTTPVTTTTSTTSTTTTSNPGDMEENSGTLGTTTTTAPTDTTCSVYETKRQCQKHKKDGCDWDRTTRVCRHEDEEEMDPNSESGADDDVCASLSKRRSKCQKQGCVWSRSKTNKENRCQSSSGQYSSGNLASKSSKQ